MKNILVEQSNGRASTIHANGFRVHSVDPMFLLGDRALSPAPHPTMRESGACRGPRSRARDVSEADTCPPIHSLSCTRAGCSAASGPNGLRRGNRAFAKELLAAAGW